MEKRSKIEALCLNCNKWVRYRTEWCDETEELGGHMVTYRGLKAFCLECGKEMVADDVDDYNLRALYAQYRKDYDFITPEEAEEVTKKYAIAPEDLSALLGWKEYAVGYVMKGHIPSKGHSEILRSLLKDEAAYRILLEDNRDNISQEAYERSRATLRDDMSPEEFAERYGIGGEKDWPSVIWRR